MGLLHRLLGIPTSKEKHVTELKNYAVHCSYTRLFTDGGGNLTHDGKIVLADLCKQAGLIFPIVARKEGGEVSMEDMLLNEGKRIMVIGLMTRIFRNVALGKEDETEEHLLTNLIEEIREQ
jgi:hypothetical protein